jgi:uncharacterized damage-inducible protein DinB
MTNKDALRRLLDYTSWGDHRVLRAAATVSVDDFKRDLGGSHGGLRGTLVHILGAHWIWLERFKGVSPTQGWDEGDFPDVVALSERWCAIEAHRDAWFRGLRLDAVSKRIAYRSMKGDPFSAPLWQLVQHVANHASFHRGQAVMMLRQLGVTPPATDFVLWDREAKARAARQRENPAPGGKGRA